MTWTAESRAAAYRERLVRNIERSLRGTVLTREQADRLHRTIDVAAATSPAKESAE